MTKRRLYDGRGGLDYEKCDGVEEGGLIVDWRRMRRYVRGSWLTERGER